jgi:hypothetical protein
MVLWMYTIYCNPSDYPGEYVIRRHAVQPGLTLPDDRQFARAPTLKEVRKMLPPGLYNLGRYSSDDPVIVEVWV